MSARRIAAAAALAACALSFPCAGAAGQTVRVRVETARLETQAERPVKIEVIQAGINPSRRGDAFPAIPLERTSVSGILHRDGTISMARSGPDTAVSDFFICIGDQPSLDLGGARNPDGQGFAAFGRVVAGRDVVRAIHKAPAGGERLSPPVVISRASRVKAE